MQAEIHLRTDIRGKLTRRRAYRRTRRSRKTRYRAARWANRCRPSGWLVPSLRSKAETTVKAVRFVAQVLPIGQITVEIGSFDTQKSEPKGVRYCLPARPPPGLPAARVSVQKWQRRCAYCHTSRRAVTSSEHILPAPVEAAVIALAIS